MEWVIKQDGNVERTDVLVGGSLSYRFGPVTALLSFKVPLKSREVVR